MIPALAPKAVGKLPALTGGSEHAAYRIRHDEPRVAVPPENLLGRPHLILAERRSVRGGRALLVRSGIGDHRAHADQRRARLLEDRLLDRRRQRRQVIGVLDGHGVPAVRPEARLHVLGGKAQRRLAIDRDPVVVVEIDEPAEPEMTCERRRLGGHSLHQIAVGAQREDAVIHHLSAVALAQEPLGQGHPDAVGEPLSERAGRRLHPRRHAALRVPRRARPPLPEALDLGQRQVIAREVQNAVEQHRAVPGGQNEAIPVRPLGIGGIESQEAAVEDVRHRCHRHRQAGMPGSRLLHRIHAQCADRVHAQSVERIVLLPRQPRGGFRVHADTAITAGLRVPSPPSATAAFAVTR